MSPSALGNLTTCGRSSPAAPVKSGFGLRPMTTSRSSEIKSPADSRSTPSTGLGTTTGSGGSAAPHRRQAASLGGFTCPAGQISAGTAGPILSGGGAGRAASFGRSPRLTVYSVSSVSSGAAGSSPQGMASISPPGAGSCDDATGGRQGWALIAVPAPVFMSGNAPETGNAGSGAPSGSGALIAASATDRACVAPQR